MKKKIYITGMLIALIGTSCSSYLTSSVNVSKHKKKYDKILIIAKSVDHTARIKFENQVVQDFATAGVYAEPSIHVIKTESFSKEITKEQIENLRNELKNQGFDGVVITNLIDKEKYLNVETNNYYGGYYRSFYGYYGYYTPDYWQPNRIESHTQYTIESCFYDITVAQKENLQWVGRFEINNPSSIVKSIEKYSKELTQKLLEDSITY